MGRGPLKGALSRPNVKIMSCRQQRGSPMLLRRRSTLLELSNSGCLPGRAGGSPVRTSATQDYLLARSEPGLEKFCSDDMGAGGR